MGIVTKEEGSKKEIEKKMQETDLLTREFADEKRVDIMEEKRHPEEKQEEAQE